MNAVLLQIVAAVGVIALFGVWVATRLRRRQRPTRGLDPYVNALAALVDGDEAFAFSALEKAVRAGGAPPDAYVRLGGLLRERGDAVRALQVHRGLTVKDDLTKQEKRALFLGMAEDYSALGRPEQALRILESLRVRGAPGEHAVIAVMAREAQRSGDREKAYGYIKAMTDTEHAPRMLALYLASGGEAELREGDSRAALKSFQRALKHDPSCVPACMGMGALAAAREEIGEAMQHWTRAARESRDICGPALREMERASYRAGRFGEMEAVYREILQARPDDEEATVSLAAFYRKQGRVEEAIKLLRTYRGEHADSLRVALTLASCFASRGQNSELEELVDATRDAERSAGTWRCAECGEESDTVRWHCPRCNSFDSYARVVA